MNLISAKYATLLHTFFVHQINRITASHADSTTLKNQETSLLLSVLNQPRNTKHFSEFFNKKNEFPIHSVSNYPTGGAKLLGVVVVELFAVGL